MLRGASAPSGRRVGTTGRHHHERVRGVVALRDRRRPAALASSNVTCETRTRQAGADDRLPAERGADVVGVQPGVVPERLDAVAERALVAAGRRGGPRGVVEQRQHAGRGLRHLGALVGQLGGRSARPARRPRAWSPRASRGRRAARRRLGHRADDVAGDVADRPALAAARRVPLLGAQRTHQLLEPVELVDQTFRHQCVQAPCCSLPGFDELTCRLHACMTQEGRSSRVKPVTAGKPTRVEHPGRAPGAHACRAVAAGRSPVRRAGIRGRRARGDRRARRAHPGRDVPPLRVEGRPVPRGLRGGRARAERSGRRRGGGSDDPVDGLRLGAIAFLDAAATPEVRRIVLLDGPRCSPRGAARDRERYGLGLVARRCARRRGRTPRVGPVDSLAPVLLAALHEAATVDRRRRRPQRHAPSSRESSEAHHEAGRNNRGEKLLVGLSEQREREECSMSPISFGAWPAHARRATALEQDAELVAGEHEEPRHRGRRRDRSPARSAR